MIPASIVLLFAAVAPALGAQRVALSLTVNIREGAYLKLSNGYFYAIEPKDRIYSASWMTPFKISLSESDNPKYPIKITNLQTKTSVNGRLLSDQEAEELQNFSLQEPLPLPPQEEHSLPPKEAHSGPPSTASFTPFPPKRSLPCSRNP